MLQARFALTSAQVFSWTDLVTDSERFYNSILDLLDDSEEKDEVDQLLMWWNRYKQSVGLIAHLLTAFSVGRCSLFTWRMSVCHPKTALSRGSDKSVQNTEKE